MSRPVAFGIGAEFPPVPNLGYKEYVARVSQVGGNAPTEDAVISNTLGPVVWSRAFAGRYLLTLVGAFPFAKTAYIIPVNFFYQPIPLSGLIIQFSRSSDDTMTLATIDLITGLFADGLASQEMIQVRVYD